MKSSNWITLFTRARILQGAQDGPSKMRSTWWVDAGPTRPRIIGSTSPRVGRGGGDSIEMVVVHKLGVNLCENRSAKNRHNNKFFVCFRLPPLGRSHSRCVTGTPVKIRGPEPVPYRLLSAQVRRSLATSRTSIAVRNADRVAAPQ